MKESADKLLVRLVETTIQQPDYTKAIVDLVNGLQNQIEITSGPEADAVFEVRVLSERDDHPYTCALDFGTINMDFYSGHGITIPTVYYIAYFLSVILLEFLHLREKKEPFKVYPSPDYDQVNEHVWYGTLPSATENIGDDLSWPSDDLRQLVNAISQIRTGSHGLFIEFSGRSSKASNRISRLGFKHGYNPHHHLRDVFIHSDRELVIEVSQMVNSEQPNSTHNLIDLIARCDRPSASELLRALAQIEDERIAGYAALKHEERRVRLVKKEPDNAPAKGKLKDFKHTVSIPVEVSAAKAAVSAVVGTKVAAATSEYYKPVDALGYQSYAEALGDLITHPKTGTPLTLAICGPWGTGKSTLMRFIKDRINKNATRKKEFVQIDFNAWEYSKSDAIWASFYSVVLKQVETGLGWLKRWQFRLYVRRKTSRFLFAAWILLVLVAIAMAFTLKLDLSATTDEGPHATNQAVTEIKQVLQSDSTTDLVVTEPESENGSTLSSDFWTMEQIAKLGPGVVALIMALWNLLVSLSRGILGKVKGGGGEKPLDQESVIKLMERISKWLERHYRLGRSDTWYSMKIPKRFVIYIDDIDRVEPNKIMLMMEAINRFLGTPGFVFVLCMDARVVRQAIGKHYSFMGKTHGDREWWGHHYLEKIIQIPFYLPRINLEGMMSLKEKLLGSFVAPPEPELESVSEVPSDDKRPESETDAGKTTIVAPTAEGIGTEQPVEPVISVESPAMPIVDDSMEMELKRPEDEAFDELFSDGLEMAPRLMVRLKNVYLLARHVYLKSTGESKVPPVFTKWIALSVRYPFEIKELVETCTLTGWPVGWQEVTDTMDADPDSGKRKCLSQEHLEKLKKMLPKHVPSPKDVETFVAVTNCFNLVLE